MHNINFDSKHAKSKYLCQKKVFAHDFEKSGEKVKDFKNQAGRLFENIWNILPESWFSSSTWQNTVTES